MPLPSSGDITLLQIGTEFSVPTPVVLTSLFRGGAYVPNTSANAGVPTSGSIGLQSFYNASGAASPPPPPPPPPPPSPLAITPTSVSRTYTANSAISPYDTLTSYSSAGGAVTLTAGAPPTGTSIQIAAFTSDTGEIRLTGTPTTAGSFSPTLTFTSPNGSVNLTTSFTVNPGVTITNPLPNQGTTSATAPEPTPLTASLTLLSNGQLQTATSTTGAGTPFNWATPTGTGTGSNYWVRFTRGTPSGGTDGGSSASTGWLQLNVNRSVSVFSNSTTFGAPYSATYFVDLSSSPTGSPIISSGAYTLTISNTAAPPPSGGVINPLPFNGGFYDDQSSGSQTAGVDLILNPNGSLSVLGRAIPNGIISDWYSPNSAGIGNSYYVRFTRTSMSNGAGSASGSTGWLQLNTARQISVTTFSIGTTTFMSASYTVEISTSPSGSPIVAAGSLTMSATAEGGVQPN